MATKTHSGRSRKTKAEVQEEFEAIKESREAEKIESSPKTEELSRQREEEVRQALKEITSEGLVQSISALGIEVSKTLSHLSLKLTTEHELLASLREAVALEKKELEGLHKIDVCAASLDQLIEEYGQKKAALEAEIASARSQWDSEAERRSQEQREFDENLKRQRLREKEEYEYEKNSERKKEADAYEESVRTQERKNKEKQELLEKSWQAREAALKAREEEFNGLKKEVADFPERLKREAEESVAEALKALKSQHQQELVILQKDAEAQRRLSELQIKSLEETVARQFSQIESLGARLEEAKKQVQDIAVKAIEGASGAKALSHVNQIAMEQAKVRGPQT
ncbi:MAG: hypothetical protein HY748_06880 [Elusimicrobia bacterium]|nr:hypothetical protein [Elusimicrobiota bacterium]